MPDSPETQPTPETAESASADPTLGARRLLVWVISFVLGGVASALVLLITNIPLDETLPISFLYVPMLPLTALPFGFLFVIWIDYFMGTRIVPD